MRLYIFQMSYYQSYSSVTVQNSNGGELNDYELHTPSSRTYMDHRVSDINSNYRKTLPVYWRI